MNFVTVNAAKASIPLAVIKEPTFKDPTLIAGQKAVQSGDWTDKLVEPFLNVKDEIAVDNNKCAVLRGTRLIIPVTSQTRTYYKTCSFRSSRLGENQSAATPIRMVPQVNGPQTLQNRF